MDEQTKVSRSITRLVISHPFFGSMALSLKIEADEEIQTMCTDGKFIKWNPDFVANMSEEETTGVMAHEVMHVGMKHNLRRGDRDPERWNIACDYVINPILIEAGFSLPAGGLYDEQYADLPAERVYDMLPEDVSHLSQAGGMGGVIDTTKEGGQSLSEAEVKQMEADINSKVMMAANGAKSVGKLPASIEALVQRMKRNQIDWEEKVQRFVGGDQPDDYSMRRPNRQMFDQVGVLAPSIVGTGCGDILVWMDSSGSVSDREGEFFLGGLNAISRDVKPKSITVITCDAEIQSVKRYEEGEEITLFSNKGRGGTCVQPVFNYIEQHNLNVDNMICFTDMGIFDYPDRAPDYPILWVSSYSRGKPAPFGETVYLNTGD